MKAEEKAKDAAGKAAADLIESGMVVGLGTGTTATHFIRHLIERYKKGLQIRAVSSSTASLEQAKKGGIPICDINEVSRIDITVDGADEIDPQKRMIKGGGGAHVREKILASSSKEMIVIVDETKLVDRLGKRSLPVEILFYGFSATQRKLENLGYKGKWRKENDGSFFITENGNLIFDVELESPPLNPEHVHSQIIHLPGVLDTGFFFGLAGRVIIGFPDGKIQILN
jgi:ribose 5-phosphate isomerase A